MPFKSLKNYIIMKKMITALHAILSVVILVYVLQVVLWTNMDLSLNFVDYFRAPELQKVILVANYVLSYGVYYGLYAFFFFYVFVVRPNAVETMNYIFFVAFSMGVISLLKLLFAELRPAMVTALMSKEKAIVIDQSVDFGMPSGHVFTALCLYFMYKHRFYLEDNEIEAKYLLVVDSNIKDFSNLIANKNRAVYTFNAETYQRSAFGLSYKTFHILGIIFITLLLLVRVVSGAVYVSQALIGLLFGYVWCAFYFGFVSEGMRNFLFDLMVLPAARVRTLKYIALGQASFMILIVSLALIRCNMLNAEEFAKIKNALKAHCGNGFYFARRNLQQAILSFIPLSIKIVYIYFNPVGGIKPAKEITQSYDELTIWNVCMRTLIYFGPVAVGYLAYLSLEMLIVEYITPDSYGILNTFLYKIFVVLLGFHLTYAAPSILLKNNLLLVDEVYFPSHYDRSSNDPRDIEARRNKIQDKSRNAVDVENNSLGAKIKRFGTAVKLKVGI